MDKNNLNTKHEPGHEHPNTTGLTGARVGLMLSPIDIAKRHHESQRQQFLAGHQQPNTKDDTHAKPADEQPTTKNENRADMIEKFNAALRTARPEHPRPPLPPPRTQPLPQIDPLDRRLPPRTTRADFNTPDQRAIFGPPVEPLERANKVKEDDL